MQSDPSPRRDRRHAAPAARAYPGHVPPRPIPAGVRFGNDIAADDSEMARSHTDAQHDAQLTPPTEGTPATISDEPLPDMLRREVAAFKAAHRSELALIQYKGWKDGERFGFRFGCCFGGFVVGMVCLVSLVARHVGGLP